MNACMDFQNSSAYHYLELNTKKKCNIEHKIWFRNTRAIAKNKNGSKSRTLTVEAS